jgi:hypothetical protein
MFNTSPIQRWCVLGSAIGFFVALPALAQTVGGGSTTINLPPPSIDYWARGLSILAVLISAAAFIWGRVDKSRETKAKKAEKDPSIDFDVTKGWSEGKSKFELTIKNRGDVSIQVVSLSCDRNAILKVDYADLSADSRTVSFRGRRINAGKNEVVEGEIETPPSQKRPVEFIVKLLINEEKVRAFEKLFERATY